MVGWANLDALGCCADGDMLGLRVPVHSPPHRQFAQLPAPDPGMPGGGKVGYCRQVEARRHGSGPGIGPCGANNVDFEERPEEFMREGTYYCAADGAACMVHEWEGFGWVGVSVLVGGSRWVWRRGDDEMCVSEGGRVIGVCRGPSGAGW
jgi:hypothetical protein